MSMNFSKLLSFIFLMMTVLVINYCRDEAPVQPNQTCIDNQPVEDTTRVYRWPISRDTLRIYHEMVFARFYPWVKDTTQIKRLLEKHHLRFWAAPFVQDQQFVALLCVTDGRRAEYHFTPYGKEGFCNFGADSLVEYAFGVFDNGIHVPNGTMFFKFIESTPQARIDSLLSANKLRFLHTSPNFPTGSWYLTRLTPLSPKNELDLAIDLQSVPFVEIVGADIGTGMSRLSCN